MTNKHSLKYAISGAALALALGVGGCAGGGGNWGSETEGEMLPEDDVGAALNDARTAVEFARARDWIWKSTEGILKQAEEAAAEGDDAKAMKLAAKAERQAELATNQYYLEQAKMKLKNWQDYGKLSSMPSDKVDAMREAIKMGNGTEAYNIAKGLS